MNIASSIFKNFMKSKEMLWNTNEKMGFFNEKEHLDKIRNFWQKCVSNIEGFYQNSMSFHDNFVRKVFLKISEHSKFSKEV